MTALSGLFWRIVFAHDADHVLEGAAYPEGRFHHSGQPALYASPTQVGAAVAVKTYLRPDDKPRVIIGLQVDAAEVLDLRDHAVTAWLGIAPETPSVPWHDERAKGKPATSWLASDAVRKSGACGMIYASRKQPQRWHLVLFRWNQTGHAQVRLALGPQPWRAA